VISGIKGIAISDSTVTARRETGSGLEVYRFPLPAVISVKEGINLPRYPTLPGRLKAKKAEVVTTPAAATPGGLVMKRLFTPAEQKTATTILGRGPEAAPAVVDLFEELGLL
jgi:electron transfer flavoprotein beta subunit